MRNESISFRSFFNQAEGVKVFILLYKEVSLALGLNSLYSKRALITRGGKNIKVSRKKKVEKLLHVKDYRFDPLGSGRKGDHNFTHGVHPSVRHKNTL